MQESFNRILVTTDFSDSGDHAIGHAFRIAADQSATVVLCHVIETTVMPNPLYAQYYPTDFLGPEVRERAGREAKRGLLDRVPHDGILQHVPSETVVLFGTPTDEIIRFAEERAVDLIVIATHGRKGLRRWVLGSVAEQVIRHGPCPVLVVR
jgi:nucleotide-binding universal stress UspA family protein